VGRIEGLEDLKYSAITSRQGTPVRIADVADVQIGAAIKRGDGSLNAQKAVVV
jgi:Cu/Ag efflux pump CusA